MDQECVAPWEDTGRKANKLGQCLTFTVPSERKTYPSVDSYELINDPLEVHVLQIFSSSVN